jgi:hypothetical protein
MKLLPINSHLKIDKNLYYQTYGGSHRFIVRILCPITKKRYIKNFVFNNYETNDLALQHAKYDLIRVLKLKSNKEPLN